MFREEKCESSALGRVALFSEEVSQKQGQEAGGVRPSRDATRSSKKLKRQEMS